MRNGTVATLIAHTPAGALTDRTRHQRTLIIGATALISTGALLVTVTATAGFPLVGPPGHTYRTGRMQAFNHAGNVLGAAGTGLIGYLLCLRASFWLTSILGIVVITSNLAINRGLIDHNLARGLPSPDTGTEAPSGFTVLLRSRPLLALGASVLLFHLANGAMLPIAGQKLATQHTNQIHVLDGVGAGIVGALFPIMIADLTRGTGHYTLALALFARAVPETRPTAAVVSP